jgi:hypothetical protein
MKQSARENRRASARERDFAVVRVWFDAWAGSACPTCGRTTSSWRGRDSSARAKVNRPPSVTREQLSVRSEMSRC